MRFGYTFKLLLLGLFSACSGGEGSVEECDPDGGSIRSGVVPPSISESGECLSYIEGPPVGLACLHCLQPEAREQARLLARTMANSCRRELATFVIVDGSFGFDLPFFEELVGEMIRKGSRLKLYLYLANGPWQRKYDQVPSLGFGTKIPPEEFRRRIESDEALREQFRNLLRALTPSLNRLSAAGVELGILPMLEDNLDASSARAMEALVRETLPASLPYRLGRNPCRGCYDGNDASTPNDMFRDQHVSRACSDISSSNGLVSNDGANFSFPGEEFSTSIEFGGLFSLAARATAKGNDFVAWKNEFQGRAVDGAFIAPNKREYVTPNEPQLQLLTEFLQTAY